MRQTPDNHPTRPLKNIVDNAIIGTGFGIGASILFGRIASLEPNPHPIDPIIGYSYAPIRLGLVGLSHGIGRARYKENEDSATLKKDLAIASAINIGGGLLLEAGTTFMNSLLYADRPLTQDSIAATLLIGSMFGGISTFFYYLGRRGGIIKTLTDL